MDYKRQFEAKPEALGLFPQTLVGESRARRRDFDDAVWVDRLPSGHYALQIHLARRPATGWDGCNG